MMTDRSKVIKALECCMSGQTEGFGCNRVPCPYNELEDCEGVLHYDALALLKEDEPLKPKLSESGLLYKCRACGRPLTKYLYKFCPNCGRAVKWDAWLNNGDSIIYVKAPEGR